MATEEEQQRLEEAIEALPERLRKAFMMARAHGLPRAEIATRLHISERRVDRRLSRALHRVQDNLEGRVPLWHTVIRWIATPIVIPLVLLIHIVYIAVARTCGFLGLRPPRPWLR